MKLQIKYVKDNGDIENERVILKALDNINIGSYIVSDTTYFADNQISNELRHIFWIPDKDVNKDDLIVIYTKKGRDKTRRNDNGNSTHFFYWGLEKTIWNEDGDVAVLFSLKNWVFKKVDDNK